MALAQQFRNGVCEWCRAPMDDHEGIVAGVMKCKPRPETKGADRA